MGGGFLRGFFQPEFGVKPPSEEALNDALGARLWEISEQLVEQARASESIYVNHENVSNVITFKPQSEHEKKRRNVGGKEKGAIPVAR